MTDPLDTSPKHDRNPSQPRRLRPNRLKIYRFHLYRPHDPRLALLPPFPLAHEDVCNGLRPITMMC